MKVLFCISFCVAITHAGYIGHPFSPFGNVITHHPFATFTPVIHPFTQVHTTFYKQHIVPQYFPQVIPHNIVYHNVPGVIQLVPIVPPTKNGNDKGSKKPDDMKTNGKDSKKEETTEEPKKDEKKSDGEDLKA